MTHRPVEIDRTLKMASLCTHISEGCHAMHSHIMPIYQTSTFCFSDVDSGSSLFQGQADGYIYTRMGNPNQIQLAEKYAFLEGIDLLRANPGKKIEEIVGAHVFSSGMGAITAAVLTRAKNKSTIVTQKALYGATYNMLHDMCPTYGIKVVMIDDISVASWKKAIDENDNISVVYIETPTNPTLDIVDLKAIAELAHSKGAWVMVDNTFATPYAQRPLTLGCDVVVHSTTKYLSGHGVIVGGAVISNHLDYINKDVFCMLKLLGAAESPFDCWLCHLGLKTFEVRMQRHCENAIKIAEFLEKHPAVNRVWYPGLPSHPGHEIAKQQMTHFGGMISFELKGGIKAGEYMMNNVKVATLAVSLGNVDTLIQHPASMTHASIAKEDRLKSGITDGLVRLSVGIENVDDIIADLKQAMDMK